MFRNLDKRSEKKAARLGGGPDSPWRSGAHLNHGNSTLAPNRCRYSR